MDDNKVNPEENQSFDVAQDKPSQTIFETVPEEEIKPEEVAPEVSTPVNEDVSPIIPEVTPDMPPVVYQDNKSKYFILIGGVVFFLLMLGLLFKLFSGSVTGKKVTLTYWGLWEDKDIFASVIDDYQRKNPNVKINYEKMSPQDYRDKLEARSENGDGPDIFRFHNTWLPEISDVAAPLPQNIMSNSEFDKTFYKIFQTDLKVGNYYYGLPLYLDGLVLIYNDSLFKKAGIQTAPQTWDDLTNDVTKLTVKDTNGQIVTSGIALGLASNVEHFSDILGLMILQNGGSIASLDSAEASGALESFRKFAEAPNNFWSAGMPNSIAAFSQEKVAMIFAPSWEILTIKNTNPDIQLKVVSIPIVPGGKPISLANYWAEGVSKYSKNQVEAWKFLKYLVDKDTMTKLYENESKQRRFGEPYSRVDLGTLLSENEYVGAVIKQADFFESAPVIERTYDNGLNDQIVQYLKNAVNSTVQGVAYSDAFATAKQGIDQVFSKYKIK